MTKGFEDDDFAGEPNITALAVWHNGEKELGEHLIRLGQQLVDGKGLPARKPWWLRALYSNHGGGPCSALEITLNVSTPHRIYAPNRIE